jgi:N6-L-threonylcarbamoyladenine synthase
MKILGIESSADETAAAVVENGQKILSSVVASSLDQQIAYGGIVPEVAARSHLESITPVIEKALAEAFSDTSLKLKDKSKDGSALSSGFDPWDQIDGIAVTYGPGLGGCLLIGVMTARTLAIVKNKPLYAVNHVAAHPYASFLTEASPSLSSTFHLPPSAPVFPMLALIVSGGHSQLVLFKDHFDYQLLGQTHDDAVGEAFDKVAKILGLPYPGGPSIAKKAQEGNIKKYRLPKAKMDGKYDFSFSGLKTALLRTAQAEIGEDYSFPSVELSGRLSEAQKANLAASFEHTALETLVDNTLQAYEEFQPKSIVVAGGVAASSVLRQQIADRLPIPAIFPDIKLCTDNAAMIAAYGYYMVTHDQPQADPYSLDINPSLSM